MRRPSSARRPDPRPRPPPSADIADGCRPPRAHRRQGLPAGLPRPSAAARGAGPRRRRRLRGDHRRPAVPRPACRSRRPSGSWHGDAGTAFDPRLRRRPRGLGDRAERQLTDRAEIVQRRRATVSTAVDTPPIAEELMRVSPSTSPATETRTPTRSPRRSATPSCKRLDPGNEYVAVRLGDLNAQTALGAGARGAEPAFLGTSCCARAT